MNVYSRLCYKIVAAMAMTLLFGFCLIGQEQGTQGYQSWLGKWSMTSETNGDPVKWNLVLRDSDGKLGVILVNAQGEEQVAKESSFVEGVLKFKAPYQDQEYEIELTLAGEKLNGTWRGDGNSGQTTGLRN